MEEIASESVRQLAKEGLGFLLFVISFAGNILLLLRLRDSYAKCLEQWKEAETLRGEIQEKRIIEAKQYVDLLHQGTQANQKLAESIATRTDTLNALIELNRTIQKDGTQADLDAQHRTAAIQKTLDEVIKRLESIAERAFR